MCICGAGASGALKLDNYTSPVRGKPLRQNFLNIFPMKLERAFTCIISRIKALMIINFCNYSHILASDLDSKSAKDRDTNQTTENFKIPSNRSSLCAQQALYSKLKLDVVLHGNSTESVRIYLHYAMRVSSLLHMPRARPTAR